MGEIVFDAAVVACLVLLWARAWFADRAVRASLHELRQQLVALEVLFEPSHTAGDGHCLVKTFRYADGHVAEKHSKCGGIPVLEMTEEWAARLHPHAPLVGTETRRH